MVGGLDWDYGDEWHFRVHKQYEARIKKEKGAKKMKLRIVGFEFDAGGDLAVKIRSDEGVFGPAEAIAVVLALMDRFQAAPDETAVEMLAQEAEPEQAGNGVPEPAQPGRRRQRRQSVPAAATAVASPSGPVVSRPEPEKSMAEYVEEAASAPEPAPEPPRPPTAPKAAPVAAQAQQSVSQPVAPALLAADSFRKVIEHLLASGFTTHAALVAECQRLTPVVPVLSRLSGNLSERTARCLLAIRGPEAAQASN
jgi:hypothetical protein